MNASPARVLWLFSLIRSGSSIAAYSAAAPWGHAVADEPFGPWDRTGPPYGYPREQDELQKMFGESSHELTPPVVALAESLFSRLARDPAHGHATGSVVVKIPHHVPTPGQVARAWPTQRAAYLLRNPLHRLNSLYVRGWLDPSPIGPNHDLEQYRAFARVWMAQPAGVRITYDMIRREPAEMYRRIFIAWRLAFTREHVERAVAYAATNYHHASRDVTTEHDTRRVLSESRSALPREAVHAYLDDPEMRELFRVAGWSLDPRAYLAT
ncbi:MAG: hypothetical protein KIT19_02050 [Phycisphaeraceae bacterium]|nr:hypothetical protein [Phycisphaeraceae bacterium]